MFHLDSVAQLVERRIKLQCPSWGVGSNPIVSYIILLLLMKIKAILLPKIAYNSELSTALNTKPRPLDFLHQCCYSGRKFGKYPYNTRPMESTPLLQPKSGI